MDSLEFMSFTYFLDKVEGKLEISRIRLLYTLEMSASEVQGHSNLDDNVSLAFSERYSSRRLCSLSIHAVDLCVSVTYVCCHLRW